MITLIKTKSPQILKATVIASCLMLVYSACTSSGKVSPPEPIYPIPTDNQMAWHEMEMNAFIHFTTNTFTNLEWGYGDESPSIFNPTELDVEQWVTTIKDAGLKGLILTTKHHDGFCLWPSEYTEHSVKNSSYKDGEGDIVKEVSDACAKHGLKFGVYLSPWDRNRSDYGEESYITYFRNQLVELLSNYGPVFEMWFDGANGGDGYYGGAREARKIDNKTYYEWPTTIEFARNLQPNIIFFSDAGPEIRWVGNERGYVGATNWNTITPDTLYAGKAGIEDLLNRGSEDGTHWIPGEVDVSIRAGWFYHAHEDSKVKAPEELFDIYLTSVGRGSVLLLNIPPDRRGLIHENDVKSLQGFRSLLDSRFAKNIAQDAKITADSYRGKSKQYSPDNMIDNDKNSYWATDDNVINSGFEITFENPEEISYILLQEFIQLGQRIKSFNIEVWENDNWKEVASATTIGYKRILKLDPVTTNKIRVNINDSKACPTISNFEVY